MRNIPAIALILLLVCSLAMNIILHSELLKKIDLLKDTEIPPERLGAVIDFGSKYTPIEITRDLLDTVNGTIPSNFYIISLDGTPVISLNAPMSNTNISFNGTIYQYCFETGDQVLLIPGGFKVVEREDR